MSGLLMKAIMLLGLAAKQNLGTGARAPVCQCCGGTAPGPIIFDCCQMLTCRSCAGRFVTPLGGNRYRVHCRCGSVRNTVLE